MANKLYPHRFLVSLFSFRCRCFSETPLSRFVDTMSCNKNTVTLFTCRLSSPRNSFLNVLIHEVQISIHLNLFTSTPFFDCLPLFWGSGMKPKVRARLRVLVNSYFGQLVPKNSYFTFPWSTRTLCLWSTHTF